MNLLVGFLKKVIFRIILAIIWLTIATNILVFVFIVISIGTFRQIVSMVFIKIISITKVRKLSWYIVE